MVQREDLSDFRKKGHEDLIQKSLQSKVSSSSKHFSSQDRPGSIQGGIEYMSVDAHVARNTSNSRKRRSSMRPKCSTDQRLDSPDKNDDMNLYYDQNVDIIEVDFDRDLRRSSSKKRSPENDDELLNMIYLQAKT